MPQMDYIHRELRRKGVTLQLLWYEYKQEHPNGFQYSFFCEQYRNWVKKLDPPLRQKHLAGEKMFVDFAGQTVDIIDAATGQVSKAHIFILHWVPATIPMPRPLPAKIYPAGSMPTSMPLNTLAGTIFFTIHLIQALILHLLLGSPSSP